jgi:hypothetical protein
MKKWHRSRQSRVRTRRIVEACNPSYSGGRDQEDLGSKPVWANSLPDPILKKSITKKGLVEWLKV